jgi:copper chaperone
MCATHVKLIRLFSGYTDMIRFTVSDMTCGHCVETLTRHLKALDPAIVLSVDLPHHALLVTTSTLSPQDIENALRDAGYTPELH